MYIYGTLHIYVSIFVEIWYEQGDIINIVLTKYVGSSLIVINTIYFLVISFQPVCLSAPWSYIDIIHNRQILEYMKMVLDIGIP